LLVLALFPNTLPTGDQKLTFRATADGEVRRYRLYVPENLDPERRYPLLVVLHGYHGNENSYFDKYRQRGTSRPVLLDLAEERGYIVIAPRARRQKPLYAGKNEQDVLDLIDLVSSKYPVHSEQIFLTGHSSGGVGTWKIGFRFAARFAALAAVGSAFRHQPDELGRLPLAGSPGMPLLYVQGRRDRLATNRMAANLVDFLGPRLQNFVYREFPDGHNTLGVASLPTVFDFFDSVRNGADLMPSHTVSPLAPAAKSSTKKRSVKKSSTVKRSRTASAKRRTRR
jgi:predicted esterase